MMENHFLIFTASSFDPRLKIGAGCSLVIADLTVEPLSLVTKNFKDINATCLELETMIWAIENFRLKMSGQTSLHMVCSNFKTTKDLLQRREKLEQTNYAGSKTGTVLANADLYKKIFKLYDRLNFEMFWMDAPTSETEKDFKQVMFLKACQQAQKALNNQLKDQNQIASKWF